MKKIVAILLVLLVTGAFVFVGCAKTCPTCYGTGECPTCMATGNISSQMPSYMCPMCYGSNVCPMCRGDGKW